MPLLSAYRLHHSARLVGAALWCLAVPRSVCRRLSGKPPPPLLPPTTPTPTPTLPHRRLLRAAPAASMHPTAAPCPKTIPMLPVPSPHAPLLPPPPPRRRASCPRGPPLNDGAACLLHWPRAGHTAPPAAACASILCLCCHAMPLGPGSQLTSCVCHLAGVVTQPCV
jgi:hypothetical protein